MNEIKGQWKVSQIMQRDPDTFDVIWQDVDAFLAANDDREMGFMAGSILEFTDDGIMRTLIPFGEDMREAVESEGMEIVNGSFAVLESKKYELRDDGYYYDSGMKGEVFGEAVDPWQKLQINDGVLEMMVLRYVRA